MRKLVWITVGFAAGVGAGIYILQGLFLVAAILAMGTGAAVLWLLGRKTPLLLLGSCAAVGCFLGMGCLHVYDQLRLEPLREYDGMNTRLTIQLSDYSQTTDFGLRGTGTVELRERSYKVNFYVNAAQTLSPGDRIQGDFLLRFTGPGGTGEDRYRQGEGVFLIAYPKGDIQIQRAKTVPGKFFPVVLRSKIIRLLQSTFSSESWGFAAALLLGDTDGLSPEDDEAFTTSGLRHMIAVSGMHVAFLFSILFLFFGKHRLLLPLVGFPTLVIFALLTGCTPSILRACAMQGLMLGSLLVDREYDPPTALAFSVLVILGANPLAFVSVSFQLSVACVMGIFMFSGRIQRWFAKRLPLSGKSIRSGLLRTVTQAGSVSLGATALVTPLCAVHFGTVSLVGLLANLLTLWIIPFLFSGVLVVCILGLAWPGMGAALAWVLALPMEYVLLVARGLSRVPYAALSMTDPYVNMWLWFSYGLFGLFLLGKPKRPAALLVCVSITLVGSMVLSAMEYGREHFRMTVFDVGQGQCILLQSGDRVYVVDCGGSSDEAADLTAQILRSAGVTAIDGLILTHFDRDHGGDAQTLMDQFPVSRVYVPDTGADKALRIQLESTQDAPLYWVRQTQTLSWSKGSCTLYPPGEAAGEDGSMCILFQTEKCAILITGDTDISGEIGFLKENTLPRVDILVAGHHGARTATSLQLLKTLEPRLAVISVGENNRYGHPHSQTLFRLEQKGIQVLRTDETGTIVIRG